MEKQELLKAFKNNHQTFTQYIDDLDIEKFIYANENKWSAGQQLKHVLLTLTPFPKILPSKNYLSEKFGTLDRSSWDYETVLNNYLKTNRQAPQQFVPNAVILFEEKEQIIRDIKNHIETITFHLNNYSEEELDLFSIPHPLLGKLTIREMFYLMSYHPLHHLKQIEVSFESYRK